MYPEVGFDGVEALGCEVPEVFFAVEDISTIGSLGEPGVLPVGTSVVDEPSEACILWTRLERCGGGMISVEV